jgi:hypothetical protein
MDKLFGMYFVEALAEAKRTAKREENRKRRRKMSAEAQALLACTQTATLSGLNLTSDIFILRAEE